jgi:O-antigen/teichoic acid export membrane protein
MLRDVRSVKEPSKKSFVKAVAVLSTGTAVGQAILILSAPILTRLYSPEQFGLLAIYLAAITIPSVLATLRYELVIPLPHRDDIAVNALVLTLLCVVTLSGLCSIAFGFWGEFLFGQIDIPSLMMVRWLVPLGILSIGTYAALSHWYVRRRTFGIIAKTKFTQAAGQTFIQIIFAMSPFATFGLLLGSLAGQAAGIGSFLKEFRRTDIALLRKVSWRRIWFVARYYWHFPAISLWGSVAYAASNHLPALLVFHLFGPATSGFYILAQRIGMMPATMVSEAMGRAVYRTLATSKKNPQAIGRMVLVPVETVMNLILAPAIFAALIAPYLTGFVFGPGWQEAGLFFRWMTPWFAATIIFGVMSPIVAVMGLQKMGLVFQISSMVVSLAAMYIAGHFWGAIAAIASYSITRGICITVYRFHMLYLLRVSPLAAALRLLIQTTAFTGLFWYAANIFTNLELDQTSRWSALGALAATASAIYIVVNLFPLIRDRFQRRSHSSKGLAQ